MEKIKILRNKGPSHPSPVSAGIGYSIGNVLIKSVSFLLLPIFTRLLSTEDYGLFSMYQTYESVLWIVVCLVLHGSLKAANIEFRGHIDDYVSSVLLLPLFLGALLIIIVSAFGNSISAFIGFQPIMITVMVLHCVSSAIIAMYNNKLSLNYQYKKYLLVAFCCTIGEVSLSLSLIIFVFNNNRYLGRTFGTAGTIIAVALILLFAFFRRAAPKFNKTYWRFGLKYSLPLIPHGLSQIVLAQFGKIVIARKIGNSEAGIYGIAITISSILQIIASSIDTVYGPWFFEQYRQGNHVIIKNRTKLYVVAFSILTIGVCAVSPDIVLIMTDESFASAAYIVIPVVIGVYFMFLYYLPSNIEYYLKKTKYIAYGTLSAAAINVMLNYLCIIRFGYQAAAYVTLATYALYFVFHMCIAKKLQPNLPFYVRHLILTITITLLCVVWIQLNINSVLLRFIGFFIGSTLLLLLSWKEVKSFIFAYWHTREDR